MIRSKAVPARLLARGLLPLMLCLCVNAHARCLMKTVSVTSQLTAQTFMIASQAAEPTYIAQGFKAIDCPGDLRLVRAYVVQICSASSTGPTAPVLDTVLALGVARQQACADAQAGLSEITGTSH